MVAFMVKNFGGEIPRQDDRLLPDDMAVISVNVDAAHGTLAGLSQPELVITLSAPFPIRKAYRIPNPVPPWPDAWLPLPSEFSSVVRSPLANDTLHRVYWTNPPGSPQAGVWWNGYYRIEGGNTGANAPYNLGFTAPSSTSGPSVSSVTGGTWPGFSAYGADVVNRGGNPAGLAYAPGQEIVAVGGTPAPGSPLFACFVGATTAQNIQLANGGVGGTAGPVTLTGTTGAGTRLQVHGTIGSGGNLVAIDGIITGGVYTTNPSNPTQDTVSGGGLSGCIVSYTLGVWSLKGPVVDGLYTTLPPDPTPTTNVPGQSAGDGCTISLQSVPNGAPPLVDRSYCYTFIDIYNAESSPSAPSNVVGGPDDASWVISGLPTSAPAPPSGMNYPPVSHMRLYRTLTGTAGGAQFYAVADINFGSSTYTDTLPSTSLVNNNLLQTASWAPPLANMDGLTALPGGMLIGFTDNTVHFCEPDYPHAWPAAYDQSLLYPIVGFAVWQQNVIALTSGFPSQGSGTTPSQFVFSQVQAPEPCLSRGSIVTDLAGVYYASQNGLIMLNYFGMQNQTLSNMTRKLWLTEYQAASIIACRHRSQYLAINGTGMGFMIDYSEARMGVQHISPFANIVSVWNDAHTGDAYMCDTSNNVYRWDSTVTPPLTYQWRSKEFYLPAPTSLGACQISSDPSIAQPAPPAVVQPPSGMPNLVLPSGVNALFRLYVGPNGQNKILEKYLYQPREIFRLPSGLKAFDWQFEIVSRIPIHSVELASTMRELRKV